MKKIIKSTLIAALMLATISVTQTVSADGFMTNVSEKAKAARAYTVEKLNNAKKATAEKINKIKAAYNNMSTGKKIAIGTAVIAAVAAILAPAIYFPYKNNKDLQNKNLQNIFYKKLNEYVEEGTNAGEYALDIFSLELTEPKCFIKYGSSTIKKNCTLKEIILLTGNCPEGIVNETLNSGFIRKSFNRECPNGTIETTIIR